MRAFLLVAASLLLIAADANACGQERWQVKTLTDSAAKTVNYRPQSSSVCALNTLAAPEVSFNTPRQSAEERSYRVTATLVKYKLEGDEDIHLVLNAGGCSMIAESPALGCTHGAQARYRMFRSRQLLEQRFGVASRRWRYVNQTVTVSGVLLFDVPHGQSGVADNAVELHPITGFQVD